MCPGLPRPSVGGFRSGPARGDLDAVCHDEGRIEANPELADEIDPLARLFHKGLGAGPGDGAQIVDKLVLTHPNAAVGDGQRLGRLVGGDDNVKQRRLFQKRWCGNGLVTQLVQRIGRIGNQLTQENIPVGINRMHHELQKLGHFRLERVGFYLWFFRRFRHFSPS